MQALGEGLHVSTEPWFGDKGCPQRVCFPRGHIGVPMSNCLFVPFRLWLPRRGKFLHPQRGWGEVLRSMPADFPGWELLSAVMPGGPQNSGQVGPRRSRWQRTTWTCVRAEGENVLTVEVGAHLCPLYLSVH